MPSATAADLLNKLRCFIDRGGEVMSSWDGEWGGVKERSGAGGVVRLRFERFRCERLRFERLRFVCLRFVSCARSSRRISSSSIAI